MNTYCITGSFSFDNIKLIEDCSQVLDNKEGVLIKVKLIDPKPQNNILSAESGSTYANYHHACKTVFIHSLDNVSLSMDKAIPVTIEYWGEYVTAFSYDIEEYGVGVDEFEALKNFRDSIADLYSILKENKDNLGSIAKRQWDYLTNIIKDK